MPDKPERYVLRKKVSGQCFQSSSSSWPDDQGMELHKTFETAKEASDWINENCDELIECDK